MKPVCLRISGRVHQPMLKKMIYITIILACGFASLIGIAYWGKYPLSSLLTIFASGIVYYGVRNKMTKN